MSDPTRLVTYDRLKCLGVDEVISPATPILLGFRGSVAHNMYVPNNDPNSVDDVDLMSVVIAPLSYYFASKAWGSSGSKEHWLQDPGSSVSYDCVFYELKKMISMLGNANPNVLSFLFMRPEHYLLISPLGQKLLDNRQLFLSRRVYHSFHGYAYSQLLRMTSGKREGYMGEKRKKLVEKFGYDTKNAAHLIRLLRMGREILSTGQVMVSRHDAAELLEVKLGQWSLERVQETAAQEKLGMEAALENSPLPEDPDWQKIEDLSVEILSGHFKENLR